VAGPLVANGVRCQWEDFSTANGRNEDEELALLSTLQHGAGSGAEKQ
jgi:hypothetical protein